MTGAVVFVTSNLAITLACILLAAFFVPRVKLHLERVRWSGGVFLIACTLTHLELVYQYFFASDQTVKVVYTDGLVPLIHLVQGVSAWFLVTGLYLELKWRAHSKSTPEGPA